MPEPVSRVRLDLTRLDDRTVPSAAVDTTTTARPFDFVATGTLTTNEQFTDGTAAFVDAATTAVTLTGSIDYASNTAGTSGTVTVNGTGTGSETPAVAGTPGALGSYAQTLSGALSFTDADGTVATVDPLTGSTNWFTPAGDSGTEAVGPQTADGTFDVSTFALTAGWGADGDASTGTLSVTLANATSQATDLAFGDQSATLSAAGDVNLDFTATVTGDLMTAATHTTAVTGVTAVWEGGGKTQTVSLDAPIYWNTGSVTVHATGLTPPAWAETLTVKLDAANTVAEGDETNNTWTVTLADLETPPELPADPPADDPTPTEPAPPPRAAAASFALVDGKPATIRFIDSAGTVISTQPAFSDFRGPVSIAAGDVNGDGVLDVAVAAGAGGGPRVRVLDGQTGGVIADFFAYAEDFRGGVNVAVGDTNGDGKAEVVTGAGLGGGPHVRVFDVNTGAMVTQFFAYGLDSRGGVSVAAGDLDGDGKAEIITGAGDGPDVVVFDGGSGTERFRVTAAPATYRGAVRVTAVRDTSTAQPAVVVTADPQYGPLTRFRSQLAAGEDLLTRLPADANAIEV